MSDGVCRKKLTILSKNAEGRTGAAQTGKMECQNQVSETFCCMSLEMGFSPGPCEDPTLAITQQLKGVLRAVVEVIRDQETHRGCFSGNWQLFGDSGVVAAGELSGTVGAGTHRSPAVPTVCAVPQDCENCSAPDHFEGKMTGQVLIQGEFLGAEICASVAGTGPLEPPMPPAPPHHLLMAIEGVLISCCPP